MVTIPSFKELLSIQTPMEVIFSPKGDKIAYIVEFPNWKDNRFEKVCYVYYIKENQSYRLNKMNSDVSNLRWFSDDSLAMLLKNFDDKEPKNELFLYENLIGDGLKVSNAEKDITSFECYLNGFVYKSQEEAKKKKAILDNFGDVVQTEQEKSKDSLFFIDLSITKKFFNEQLQTIKTDDYEESQHSFPKLNLTTLFPDRYTIENFFVSNDKNRIFINCRLKDDLIFGEEKTVFVIDGDVGASLQIFQSEKASEKLEKKQLSKENSISIKNLNLSQINLPKGSSILQTSKAGDEILIDYHVSGENYFYLQKDVWILNLNDLDYSDSQTIINNMKCLTDSIDQDIQKIKWVQNRIFFHYYDHCNGIITIFDTETEIYTRITTEDHFDFYDFDVSKNFDICAIGSNSTNYTNIIFLQNKNNTYNSHFVIKNNLDQDLLGSSEVISWESKDGAIIEGVLRKPTNFDPKKKYRLVLIVHGGPTWISRLEPLGFNDKGYYPTIQFINNDILVLKPNYRGSIGRGADFMKLNVDNLGVGDLWDIESGVDYLISQGFVDEQKVGCMGWSQGGYISAFATTNSNKFKAISVGAGISDWYTYYISTDIRQFTKHYLHGHPYENRQSYLKTSPMTNISHAKTPTLIQHGSADARVPYSNATELFRSLKELGIQVELFTYPNMPHGIHKPKENRALVSQNFHWFMHHLKDEPLIFFEDQ